MATCVTAHVRVQNTHNRLILLQCQHRGCWSRHGKCRETLHPSSTEPHSLVPVEPAHVPPSSTPIEWRNQWMHQKTTGGYLSLQVLSRGTVHSSLWQVINIWNCLHSKHSGNVKKKYYTLYMWVHHKCYCVTHLNFLLCSWNCN